MKWEKGRAGPSQFYSAKNMKEINFMVGEEILKMIEDGKEGRQKGTNQGKGGPTARSPMPVENLSASLFSRSVAGSGPVVRLGSLCLALASTMPAPPLLQLLRTSSL